MMDTFENRKVVLSSMVGSWASNLNTPESDEDWKYFVVPTFDDLYSGKMFATASVSSTFDYDVHDIRQLGNLLWKANLNFISVLFGRKSICVPELNWIFDNAEIFATMNLPYFYNATMGMHFEKMSTLKKGTGNTQVLIEKYGYDTKQACHALRCLYVLERFMNTKNMRTALWFDGFDREILINIKAGAYPLAEFELLVSNWQNMYKEEIKTWYQSRSVNNASHELLEAGIKDFIRINL